MLTSNQAEMCRSSRKGDERDFRNHCHSHKVHLLKFSDLSSAVGSNSEDVPLIKTYLAPEVLHTSQRIDSGVFNIPPLFFPLSLSYEEFSFTVSLCNIQHSKLQNFHSLFKCRDTV